MSSFAFLGDLSALRVRSLDQINKDLLACSDFGSLSEYCVILNLACGDSSTPRLHSLLRAADCLSWAALAITAVSVNRVSLRYQLAVSVLY